MTLKLGSWNLMLPVADRRRQVMRLHTDRESADVWVLTETHDGFTPGHPHSHSSAARRDGRHKPEHRWVTIWSRHPMEPLVTWDEARTVAARVRPESGVPFVVYGTVLPWMGSAWLQHPGAGGVAFREAVKVQAADWVRLRHEYPNDEFFILGDFNQDLVRPRYYGSAVDRAALETALDSAGLVALTAGDGDPIRRDSAPCACIDHICARRDSTWRAEAATRWPNEDVPDRKLTDHFGVAISFKHM